MYKNNIDSIAFKGFDSVQTILELLENPAVQGFLGKIIDERMATSGLEILKRLKKIEQILGITEYWLGDSPTIPDRLEQIEQKLGKKYTAPRLPHEATKTEQRAELLVQELHAQDRDYMTAKDVLNFLKNKLPESCALPKSVKNLRKVKQDVLEKASTMFPNVFTDKKKQGRREVRVYVGGN